MAQDFVACLVDMVGLRNRPVIHPDDDVALRIAGQADAEGVAGAIENDERAGRVESDALDVRGREAGFL